jgi:hypothetical protein
MPKFKVLQTDDGRILITTEENFDKAIKEAKKESVLLEDDIYEMVETITHSYLLVTPQLPLVE